MKHILSKIAIFFSLVLITSIAAAVLLVFVYPKLSIWSWTAGFSWPDSLKGSTTVIERTEQVILSPEEGIERFITAPRTAVVSLISTPEVSGSRPVLSDLKENLSSGVLVTNDGLVATFAPEKPVTENRRFMVFFSDDKNSTAQYVAYDPVLKVAYFRTTRSDTAAIPFANSSDIRPGRRFVALSAGTYGEKERVAAGVISEYARTFNLSGKTVASSDAWEGVFLTDHTLSSSFSGGAVVAMNGELIGLAGTMLLDGKEASFVIPSNAIRQSLRRVTELATDTSRSDFGAYYISLSPSSALMMGLARDRGAYVYTPSEKSGLAIISGSIAERLGLRFGDIIISVNDAEINLDRPFSVALNEIMPGQELRLSVERSGKMILLQGIR